MCILPHTNQNTRNIKLTEKKVSKQISTFSSIMLTRSSFYDQCVVYFGSDIFDTQKFTCMALACSILQGLPCSSITAWDLYGPSKTPGWHLALMPQNEELQGRSWATSSVCRQGLPALPRALSWKWTTQLSKHSRYGLHNALPTTRATKLNLCCWKRHCSMQWFTPQIAHNG